MSRSNSTMKSNNRKLVLIIFLVVSIIITTSPSSATEKASKKGGVDQEINAKESNFKIASMKGVEKCKNGDEECLMRRAVLEAHLDYIYTQNDGAP